MSIAFPLHMRYDGYDAINRGSDANHRLARGDVDQLFWLIPKRPSILRTPGLQALYLIRPY